MKIASNPRFWLLALVALVLMVVFSTLPSESASGQELDAMLQLLTERVNRSPEHSDSWRMLGKRYIQLGHVEDAIKALETSLQLDPESAASHCDLGRLLLSTGDRQQAELHFQQVALLAPTSSYAKNLAAEGLVVIGPTDES